MIMKLRKTTMLEWVMRYLSWLRHYATSRKVAGSIPDEFIELFNWPNPSSRITSLGSIQSLTEVSAVFLGGWRVRLTTSPPVVSRLSRENVGASTPHTLMGLHGLLQGSFSFYNAKAKLKIEIYRIPSLSVYFSRITWWWPIWAATCWVR
jgi:hypothetical protein